MERLRGEAGEERERDRQGRAYRRATMEQPIEKRRKEIDR